MTKDLENLSNQKDYFVFLVSSFVLFLCLFYFSSPLLASDEPFIYPSNWGGTGLMEIPTARIMRENTYHIGISQIDPYRFYYGAIGLFKRFEIEGRVTEILDVEAFQGTGDSGNFKDKAADIKYQLIPEYKYMPAVALGIMDPSGTRVYASQYIVANKQIYPFDLTIGFGNGRFGKTPLPSSGEGIKVEMFGDPKEWLKGSQFFWGVQFAPSNRYAVMLEYSPIKYHIREQDKAAEKYFREPVPSKFNIGLRYKPTRWSEVDISYQRGNRIGVNFSTTFDIGRPLIPIFDLPYKETDRSEPVSERLIRALNSSGFSDIVIDIKDDELWIEAQNDKYYYNIKAIKVILRLITEIYLEDIQDIHIVLKKDGIPIYRFTTTKADVIDLYSEKLTFNNLLYLSEIDTSTLETLSLSGRHKRLFRYDIRPSIETFLNDPSGFFKYRLGLSGSFSYHPWKGASIATRLEGYPLNTVSTTNEPLSIPVRSDIALYKKEKVLVGRLMLDQIVKMQHELYGRFAGGLLEVQYAGFDGEIAKPFLNRRLLVGIGGSVVKKRDIDNPFKLKEDAVKDLFTTAFFNIHLNLTKHDISIDIKSGRFLGGDIGSRITISKFIRGVVVSVWYSVTDTSVFEDDFNRGYHDKGIAVTIPLRIFKGTDTKISYTYSLSPWTRDVAQDIEHYTPLFDFIGRGGLFAKALDNYLTRRKK